VSVEVRAVRPEELEEAGAVTALAYAEFARPGDPDWEDYVRRIADVADRVSRTTVLVAVEDGRVLGSVTLELEGRTEAGHQDAEATPLPPHEAHVRMLGVHPHARGRGIGRLLMLGAMEEARLAGKTLMTLNTTRRMRAAQAMYDSLGFERGPDRVFDDGFVLLSYAKRLKAGGR
jgi:ribosomal protein S18 acetylase RimI-like enzyme